nr:MAG TPA: hypothetical protein [Caudoviricetes sp.]
MSISQNTDFCEMFKGNTGLSAISLYQRCGFLLLYALHISITYYSILK